MLSEGKTLHNFFSFFFPLLGKKTTTTKIQIKPLDAFKTFYFIFNFQNLNYDMFHCRFLWFFLLEFSQLIESVIVSILHSLENFSHYFFRYTFSSSLFLLSLWDSGNKYVGSFAILSQVPEALPQFLSPFSLHCSY